MFKKVKVWYRTYECPDCGAKWQADSLLIPANTVCLACENVHTEASTPFPVQKRELGATMALVAALWHTFKRRYLSKPSKPVTLHKDEIAEKFFPFL